MASGATLHNAVIQSRGAKDLAVRGSVPVFDLIPNASVQGPNASCALCSFCFTFIPAFRCISKVILDLFSLSPIEVPTHGNGQS